MTRQIEIMMKTNGLTRHEEWENLLVIYTINEINLDCMIKNLLDRYDVYKIRWNYEGNSQGHIINPHDY